MKHRFVIIALSLLSLNANAGTEQMGGCGR